MPSSGLMTVLRMTRTTARQTASRVNKLVRKSIREFELALASNSSTGAFSENAPRNSPTFIPSFA